MFQLKVATCKYKTNETKRTSYWLFGVSVASNRMEISDLATLSLQTCLVANPSFILAQTEESQQTSLRVGSHGKPEG